MEKKFIPYPADLPPRYNASSDPCDMLIGPCRCGAWHDERCFVPTRENKSRPLNFADKKMNSYGK